MSAPSSLRPGRRPDPAIRAQWEQRLARFEQSGLSAAAFCAAEGLALASFYAWRRRLNNSALSNAQPGTHFLPVRVLPAPTPVELVLPTGAVLRLAPGCDLDFVRSLLGALGGPSC